MAHLYRLLFGRDSHESWSVSRIGLNCGANFGLTSSWSCSERWWVPLDLGREQIWAERFSPPQRDRIRSVVFRFHSSGHIDAACRSRDWSYAPAAFASIRRPHKHAWCRSLFIHTDAGTDQRWRFSCPTSVCVSHIWACQSKTCAESLAARVCEIERERERIGLRARVKVKVRKREAKWKSGKKAETEVRQAWAKKSGAAGSYQTYLFSATFHEANNEDGFSLFHLAFSLLSVYFSTPPNASHTRSRWGVELRNRNEDSSFSCMVTRFRVVENKSEVEGPNGRRYDCGDKIQVAPRFNLFV